METKIDSEQQNDGTWKSVAKITITVEDSEETKNTNFEVMAFENSYEKSVAVVTYAIYKFLDDDVDKDENWITTKKVKTDD